VSRAQRLVCDVPAPRQCRPPATDLRGATVNASHRAVVRRNVSCGVRRIAAPLKMSNWVQKDAAELLSISPRVMNYKIKTLGIEFPRGRRAAPLVAAAS
jgi:transcriptional regulator with GAF, ATPase, and Fis domain